MFNISCRLILALRWVESHPPVSCRKSLAAVMAIQSGIAILSACRILMPAAFMWGAITVFAADKKRGALLVDWSSFIQISILLKGLGLGAFSNQESSKKFLQNRSNFVFQDPAICFQISGNSGNSITCCIWCILLLCALLKSMFPWHLAAWLVQGEI